MEEWSVTPRVLRMHSALDECEWSASSFRLFTPGEKKKLVSTA
jgi:hypothetical protein